MPEAKTCPNCGSTRRTYGRGLCRACYQKRNGGIACQRCKKVRYIHAKGLCTYCYRIVWSGLTGFKHNVSTVVPTHTTSQHGLELLTLHDPDAALAERARRVEVYRQQVEQFGEVRFGDVPPPPPPEPENQPNLLEDDDGDGDS